MAIVVQDFLPQPHFDVVEDMFMSHKLPWYFNDRVVTTGRDFMFTHAFMDDGNVLAPQFFAPIQAMLPLIQARRNFVGVSRIKANLYTNQGKPIQHPEHYDIAPDSGVADKFFIGVFHVNTCNGKTVIGDEEFPSVANQLLIFDNVLHYGTVQTDQDTRVVINFTLRM